LNFQCSISKLSEKKSKTFGAWKSNFGLLLCPKSIKNGQIITDLAKTVHFGKYYFNKLQLNGIIHCKVGFLFRIFVMVHLLFGAPWWVGGLSLHSSPPIIFSILSPSSFIYRDYQFNQTRGSAAQISANHYPTTSHCKKNIKN
jgi:hypothetical protein